MNQRLPFAKRSVSILCWDVRGSKYRLQWMTMSPAPAVPLNWKARLISLAFYYPYLSCNFMRNIILSTIGIFLGALSSLLPANSFAQTDSTETGQYSVRGKILGISDAWIYLAHSEQPKKGMKIDSARLNNGEFEFTGTIDGIEAFILGLPGRDSKGKLLLRSIEYRGPLILSPGQLYIDGVFDSRKKLKAYGTAAQDEFNIYEKNHQPLNEELNRVIRNLYTTKKTEIKKIDSLKSIFYSSRKKAGCS